MFRIENYHKTKKLEIGLTYAIQETEIFAVRFDPEDALLALCTLDGIVKVYNLQTSVYHSKFKILIRFFFRENHSQFSDISELHSSNMFAVNVSFSVPTKFFYFF